MMHSSKHKGHNDLEGKPSDIYFYTFMYFVPLALFKFLSAASGIVPFVFKIFQLDIGKPNMNKQDILLLYKYNQWANTLILNAAANVTQEEYLAPASFPYGGLRGTLVHAMFAEWIWRQRWEGISPTNRFKPEDFPTFESLSARWAKEEKALMSFVEGLSDEKINGVFRYKNTAGEPHQRTLWHAMVHMVNHGTQHRTEAAAILTDLGHSPGDIDLTVFLD